jgi:nucleoside-diphosphate-sugar epimerase
MDLPSTIETSAQLEELLSRPNSPCHSTLTACGGDILILGAGGKMGPTLSRMAHRAVDGAADGAAAARRVIAVSRFSDAAVRANLVAQGVEVLSGDLLDRRFLQTLPAVSNVIYLAGTKFGATGNEAATWAANTYLPGMIAEHFPTSRIVALSTGNVYGLTRVETGGSRETDELHPVGEYAMSCLGRERMLEHFSRAQNTPISIIRLNYANELRYGVLVDIARQVQQQQPIDLTMGFVNVIWQGDANAAVVSALAHATSPPTVLNVTGPEVLRVRDVAEQFAEWFGISVRFVGVEPVTALLSNSARATQMLGPPIVSARQMMQWIVDWCRRGGQWWGKPTHFSNRDGKF